MRYQDKDSKTLRGIFPAESKATDKNSAFHSVSGQCYAISSENEITRRFELILNSGKRYSISYAMLPVCILIDNSTLYIKAYQMLVTIIGRNLTPLHQYFTNELLLWAKASPSGKDDGIETTFIKDIIVEGEAVNETI